MFVLPMIGEIFGFCAVSGMVPRFTRLIVEAKPEGLYPGNIPGYSLLA